MILKKKFHIGEISRLYQVGVDTIRYYEQIGLISPERAPSGYRLYSQKDIWRLNVIRDLRELGFSTEAIKGYLDFRDTDTALRMLRQERADIDRKMATLSALRENVDKRIRTIRVAQELPIGTPERKTLPDRRCWRTDEGYQTDEEMDLLIKALVNRGGERSYIIGNNQIGSLAALKPDGTLGYQAVVAIDPGGDRVIPGGQFLCVTYRGRYEQSAVWAKRLLAQAENEGLSVRGPMLELLWIDIHTSRLEQEHITELQLPVLS